MGKKEKAERHHFIPQFLLKGFACEVKGENYFVYQFRKGKKPHKANVKKVAVERHFHGMSEGSETDEKLSLNESLYAPLVQTLRQVSVRPEQKEFIDDFVCHLIIRTKSLRNVFTALFSATVESILTSCKRDESETFHRLVIEGMKENAGMKTLLEQLPHAERQAVLKNIESFDTRKAWQDFEPLLRQGIDVERTVRLAHQKALSRFDDILLNRKSILQPIRWNVLSYAPHTLILGDMGPISQFADSHDWQLPMRENATPEVIVLPISKEHMLVGGKNYLIETIDTESINIASVELSYDMFISSQNTEKERNYLLRLGQRAGFFNQAEWAELIRHGSEALKNDIR